MLAAGALGAQKSKKQGELCHRQCATTAIREQIRQSVDCFLLKEGVK
jgi:hypothetical protein